MNALVAYGSDSEEESGGEEAEQPQQLRPSRESQQNEQTQAKASEERLEDERTPEFGEPQQQKPRLVEPRPPRRQSDLFEGDDDDTGEHFEGEESGEERMEEDEAEAKEDELLRTGMNMAKYLMADQQPNSGACTPSAAGYTPRSHILDEDSMLLTEQQQQDGQHSQQVQVPPSPPGECSPTLQHKFERFFERKSAGWDPNAMIKARRDYKNPSLYETLVNMFGIDEKGTNFPSHVFDTNAFRPEDFYDALGDHQSALEAKRKRQQQHQHNATASGIPSAMNTSAGASAEPPPMRRPASLPAGAHAEPRQTTGRRPRIDGK